MNKIALLERARAALIAEFSHCISGGLGVSKLRLTIEIAGTVSIFSFGLIMMLATIVQWYNLNHIMWFNWNRYGEAYIEYVWCLLTLPCALYTLKVMIERLAERWSKL